MLAYDRAGPRERLPVVLLHAGIADRRMWDPLWPGLTAERDAIRLDLRGFGESAPAPAARWTPSATCWRRSDVPASTLVGASFGAGVAVELTLTAPERVASLLLAGPGGSLIAEVTPQLRAFWDAENAALEAGDLDAAVEANLDTWVPGADPAVRELVAVMQRRAFELTADWDDVEERRERSARRGWARSPSRRRWSSARATSTRPRTPRGASPQASRARG